MRNLPRRPRTALAVETLEKRELPSGSPPTPAALWQQNFDQTATGTLPGGWTQWSSQGAFGVAAAHGEQGSAGLNAAGDKSQVARTWAPGSQPADVSASVNLFVNSLIPAQVLVRGSNLDTSSPTYYAVSVTRGLGIDLLRVVNGSTRSLAHLSSAGYLSNQWLTVTLRASGTTLQVLVQRQDTGQYLNARGKWQGSSTAALHVTDSAIKGGGQVGLARAARVPGNLVFDNFLVRGANAAASAAPLVRQNFDSVHAGQLPSGWAQWNSEGAFDASTAHARSGSHSLAARLPSGDTALAWANASAPADAQISASVFLNNLAPAEVFLRGKNLGTAAPTYYAVAVSRGMEVNLLAVKNGNVTTLGQAQSATYLSNQWVRVTLQASGSSLEAIVQRLDTNQYLAPDGSWQGARTAALTVSNGSITGGGQAGVGRGTGYSDTVTFDDVTLSHATAPPLSVAIGNLSADASVNKATTVQAQVSNASHLQKVEFYLDGSLQSTDSSSPYSWTLNPNQFANGAHTVSVIAYDAGGVTARAAVNVTTTAASAGPAIPQHYSWIRIAELAYSGTPIGGFEQNLLKNSVDLVIPNTNLLPSIEAASPKTPQLIYTNESTLYQELLTDWVNWADAHHVNRESAFYHVAKPTAYSGNSPSSEQVNWFWAVYAGGSQANFADMTWAAHNANSKAVPFGATGTSVYLAYPDKFREINFSLAAGAHNGWKGVLEYPTAVDGNGNPTAWAKLTTLTDTTNGLTRSGQTTFDPPTNWVTASLNGSARMYYVRIRTVSDGGAPLANTILGRDYTNAHGTWSGTIPVFDSAADTNHDGYLNDAEYKVAQAHGDKARFAYESRLFGSYGPMRPETNPSNASFQKWAADYGPRLLQGQPMADGLFVDNSSGKAPANPGTVVESVSSYSQDYGKLLNGVGRAIAPHWLLANTSGGQTAADGVISQNTGYFEEFAIRPLTQNWATFEDLAYLVQHRQSLKNPAPYAILDSLAIGGSPTDPRTQLATLAEYYLMADPTHTFLDFYGGQEPSTSWSRHWTQAVTYNVGHPLDSWSLLSSGTDPGNHALTYHVYQRHYSNALVLYRPLSHTQGNSHDGSLSSNTATLIRLNGNYRPLHADGTLGSVITSISLRNGEGAILVPVKGGTD
jgi:hypothetical protein